jgi:hypothetical protein
MTDAQSSPMTAVPVASDWPPKFEPMKLQARRPEGGDWIDIFPSQLEWMAKEGNSVRAIEGPATPAPDVSDDAIMAAIKQAGIGDLHYHLVNNGRPTEIAKDFARALLNSRATPAAGDVADAIRRASEFDARDKEYAADLLGDLNDDYPDNPTIVAQWFRKIRTETILASSAATDVVGWCGYHPDKGFDRNTFALTQQEAVSRLMMTGIAGDHGWGVEPLCRRLVGGT